MGVFEFVIVLIIVCMVGDGIKSLMKARVAQSANMANGEFQALCDRLDKLERRMANLETIVLEAEKHKDFDRAI